MNKTTERQKRIGQQYCERALLYIHDEEKFNEVMKEFEEWKLSEGIEIDE